jgi:sRNA-binding carbon storage regulator CsrA
MLSLTRRVGQVVVIRFDDREVRMVVVEIGKTGGHNPYTRLGFIGPRSIDIRREEIAGPRVVEEVTED